ncbi:MAG: polysaccharide deacetylase family protein, partial [bacterium]|nr:polysaccharide deacetylase family protein [bacterium]
TASLTITEMLFANPADRIIDLAALPKRPLEHWYVIEPEFKEKLTNPDLPIIYGGKLKSGYFLEIDSDRIIFGLDVFGSAFFMMSRMEEYLRDDADAMKRFPLKSTLAMQEGFYNRPIVNEYIELLWGFLLQLWPKLERKPREFRLLTSHDVDTPFEQLGKEFSRIVRACLVDLAVIKNPILPLQRFANWIQVNHGSVQKDFAYTYDALMDIEDEHNIKSAFYFITGVTHPKTVNQFPIERTEMRGILRAIHRRGHEIGVHGGHFTFNDADNFRTEVTRIRNTCLEEGIEQTVWGGRQHNLQWRAPTTWRVWEEAGLDYDSTLTFSEQPGFRCGICYEYRTYDVERRQPLRLIERPLVVMDVSFIRKDYMNLTYQQTVTESIKLMAICKKYNGDFTLLWHNYSQKLFSRENLLALYRSIVHARSQIEG